MLGISGGEFVVLFLVVAILLGPERLPRYAQELARWVRELRRMAQGAREQVRSELGPEFDNVDWRKLDPRQYDPRRIVREALADTWDPDDPLDLRSTWADTLGDVTGPGNGRGGRRASGSPRAGGTGWPEADGKGADGKGAGRPARGPVFDDEAT